MDVQEFTPKTFDQIPDDVFDRPVGEIKISMPMGSLGTLHLEVSNHESLIMMWFDTGDDASLDRDIFQYEGDTLSLFDDPALKNDFVRDQVTNAIGKLLLARAPCKLEFRSG